MRIFGSIPSPDIITIKAYAPGYSGKQRVQCVMV